MNLETEIFQIVTKLPEPLQQEVLNHARQLLENHSKSNPVDGHQKKRRVGILKGTFVLPLPDDFDDPLEDFADYQ